VKRTGLALLALTVGLALAIGGSATAGAAGKTIGINVALKSDATSTILAELGTYGKVRDVLYQIDSVMMQAAEANLSAIRALPYVAAANPDAERLGAPIDTVAATDFLNGISTWDLDAINVTNMQAGPDRTAAFDGTGVYVAVLDSGLVDLWRQYFPEQRIATQFAKSFGGFGGDNVSEQPNKWEHDQSSHGTHVTSTIIGYSFRGTPVNGVAPKATIIPVKVLGQAGFGSSGTVAAGIVYVTDLKKNGALGGAPLVINMSLGGPELDVVERAAIDYAVANGVIVVASAGNEGEAGMGFPGAYAPVISAAASGWIGEWEPGADLNSGNWWNADNVPDPTSASDFYITDFSSRAKTGQDLDVAAPGSWVVGPFQLQSGKTSYFFLGGTSMASPHVAGISALIMDKNGTRTQAQVEATLESTAIPLPAGCRNVRPAPGVPHAEVCWGADATGSGLAVADAALAATP